MTLNSIIRFFFIFLYTSCFAQEEMAWMENWTNFNPSETKYPKAQKKLFNVISTDAYLPNDAVYLMSGTVYITDGATLTIQPGTIIRCDTTVPTSLVITKGSSLIAQGTVDLPIIFTSDNPPKFRKSGDWGGIVIAGSGNVALPSSVGIIPGKYLKKQSAFGGNQVSDNSIRLKYLRIEFAGKKIDQSNQYDALSLFAQDDDADIDHIMISYSGNDSFKLHGGTVDLSYLISYKAKDDDYYMDLGYEGQLQSIIAIRHPMISDASGSYPIAIEGVSQEIKSSINYSPSTVVVSDASLISLSDKTNYMHTTSAISCSNDAYIKIKDSHISGFANIVRFDKSYRTFSTLQKSFVLENSICNIHASQISATIPLNEEEQGLLRYNMFTNAFKSAKDFFDNPLDKEKPKFTLKKPKTHYTVN